MTIHLAAGQNTVLPSHSVRFQAVNASPIDVSVLVVDGNLRALSSDHFVF